MKNCGFIRCEISRSLEYDNGMLYAATALFMIPGTKPEGRIIKYDIAAKIRVHKSPHGKDLCPIDARDRKSWIIYGFGASQYFET